MQNDGKSKLQIRLPQNNDFVFTNLLKHKAEIHFEINEVLTFINQNPLGSFMKVENVNMLMSTPLLGKG